MRIALDATYGLEPNISGVGVYSQRILQGVVARHVGPKYLFCYRPHRLVRAVRFGSPAGVAISPLWGSLPFGSDVFHALNQRVDAGRHRRVVSTFHDLFVITGDYSTPEFRQRFAGQARGAAQRSDLIIAVSEFTAGQVSSLLGVERSRIRVIHHGVTTPPAVTSEARTNLILFVGALQTRKNVVRLIRAFEKTKPNWRLVLVGSMGYGSEQALQAVADSPRRANIETPGYLSDLELERLYRQASIFAFPSLDEGFGMPVLDAMARGVPVLTSNRSALVEVAASAAMLVDPFDTESIASGLHSLMASPELRHRFAVAGQAHAAKFAWSKAVDQTWQVYQELL